MKKPNFFIIGAPKCGTTSLASWLKEHPQIFVSDPKEPRFFNTDFGRRQILTWENYEAIFAEAQSQHIAVGEASTHYLGSKNAVPKILEYSPDAKFIVLLRKPQDMVVSLHAEMCRGDEGEANFETAWRLQAARNAVHNIPVFSKIPDFFQYGKVCRVGSQLECVLQCVSPEHLLVLFLEDIKKDTNGEFSRVLGLLNVDQFRPKEFSRENSRQRIRSFALKNIIRTLAYTKQLIGISVSTGLAAPLIKLNTAKGGYKPLRKSISAELDAYFQQEIELVKKIVGRVPHEWDS